MRSRPFLALWLTAVWVVLRESLTVASVVGGLLVAALVLLVTDRGPAERRRGTVRPVATLHLLAWFTWKLVEAAAIVAWEVVTPTNRINEGIVAVTLHTDSDTVAAIIANAITLTPGTLVVDVRRDPIVLYVHVLHLRSIDEVRTEVARLEQLAVRAFGEPDALRAVDARVCTTKEADR